MHKRNLLLTAVLALPLILGPSLTEASPAIRFRDKMAVVKDTDFVIRGKILSRTVKVVGKTRTTRIRVKVLRAKAQNKRGRAHRALKRGSVLEFSRSCDQQKLAPNQQWRMGYPNGRCGNGYTALPYALTRPAGTVVTLAVKLVPGQAKAKRSQTRYSIVPTTFPTTTWAIARKIK